MSELIEVVRFLLIPFAVLFSAVVVYMCKPPKRVLVSIFSLAWVAGVLNLFIDIIQQHLGFWYYTLPNLIFGYPVELYIAVSLIIGGVAPIWFWWVRTKHPKWTVALLFLLPAYLTLQDCLVVSFTGNQVMSIGNPYWWVIDFIALAFLSWGTLLVSTLATRRL